MQKENIEIKLQQSIIPEFSSGSSTHAVTQETTKRQAWKTLKPVQGLSYRNITAFTLIELLVVVLIIGILAAIALPQYQKAVAKSRLMAIIPIVKAVEKAADAYYLEHGQYVKNNIFAYDFQYPGCKSTQTAWCETDHNFRFQIEDNINIGRCRWDVVGAVTDDEGNAINSYAICLDRGANRGLIECGAKRGNSVAENVCLSIGGEHYSGGNCINIAPKVWCTRYKLN